MRWFAALLLAVALSAQAEAPAGDDTVTIPRELAEAQLAKYQALLGKFIEQQAELEKLKDAAQSCYAGFGGMHRPGPVRKP